MPIDLDTTPESLRRMRESIIESAGGNPIGERGGLVWFTDLVTKTTLVLEPHQVTAERVREKILASRRSFGIRDDHALSSHA
jgi:hypothetical protein